MSSIVKKRRLANKVGDPPRQASITSALRPHDYKMVSFPKTGVTNNYVYRTHATGPQSGFVYNLKRKMAGQGRRRMTRVKRRRRKKR